MNEVSVQKGFSLIELMVVISIISLLASIIATGLDTVRASARDTKRISEINNIRAAIEMYRSANDSYPLAGSMGGNNYVLASDNDFGISSSNTVEWENFVTALDKFIIMPSDPLSGSVGSGDNHTFLRRGRHHYTYVLSKDGNYHVFTQLESDHALRCNQIGYYWNWDNSSSFFKGYACQNGTHGKSPTASISSFGDSAPKDYLYSVTNTKLE